MALALGVVLEATRAFCWIDSMGFFLPRFHASEWGAGPAEAAHGRALFPSVPRRRHGTSHGCGGRHRRLLRCLFSLIVPSESGSESPMHRVQVARRAQGLLASPKH